MNTNRILGSMAAGLAMFTVAPAQFDFAHVPMHTVQINASTISGRPDSMRLRGYYLFRDGDQFVVLSHRPDEEGNTFIGSAFVDKGEFEAPGIVSRSGSDLAEITDHHVHWTLQTHWNHINGVTFRVHDARYIVINLNDDVKQGFRVPAIFVGHDAHKFQAGSGYVMIDMLQ